MNRYAVAGAVLGTGLILAGCGVGGFGGPEKEDVANYDITEKIAQMQVETGAGDIIITESDRKGIKVTETIHWRGEKPKAEHPINGDKVTLRYDCPNGIGVSTCSVDYRVEIPKGVALTLNAGSGNITLRAASGGVTANTGSGDIEAAGLTGKSALVETGSGNVQFKYTAIPDEVEVETGSGDATVYVPDGKYDVKLDVGSGSEKVEVVQDRSVPNKLTLTTGSGNASVLKS
ncbi:DUF4097 family beta strand repeat-containing protein [Spongiactinospora sp. 9N601]|uniref:DUF4097 family beta strand repeat-containing protein n=1 Tax=Spongiactinospora sp. 9N601 TaxID=3375149 RepID=UPI0037882532